MEFHVLLVEDDRLTLKTVAQLLLKCNYKVTCAANGREAIKVLTSCRQSGVKVDLILTDILMPEVTGFDLIHEVVHGETFCDVPVVVMSSQDSQESVLQAFQAGAADYLIKPIRKNELATLWQHVWRAKKAKVSGSATATQSIREGGLYLASAGAGSAGPANKPSYGDGVGNSACHIKDSSGGSSGAPMSVLQSTGGTTLPSHAATTRHHHQHTAQHSAQQTQRTAQPPSSGMSAGTGPGGAGGGFGGTGAASSLLLPVSERQAGSETGNPDAPYAGHGHNSSSHAHAHPRTADHHSKVHLPAQTGSGLQDSSVHGVLSSIAAGRSTAHTGGSSAAAGSSGCRPFAFNTSLAVHFDLKPATPLFGGRGSQGHRSAGDGSGAGHGTAATAARDHDGAAAADAGCDGAVHNDNGTSATVISWSMDALVGGGDPEHPDDNLMQDNEHGEDQDGMEMDEDEEGGGRQEEGGPQGTPPSGGQTQRDSVAAADGREELHRQLDMPRKRPRLSVEGSQLPPRAAASAGATAGGGGHRPQQMSVAAAAAARLHAAAEGSQGSRAASASASGGQDGDKRESGTATHESNGGDTYAESPSAYTSATTTANETDTPSSTTGSGSETEELQDGLRQRNSRRSQQLASAAEAEATAPTTHQPKCDGAPGAGPGPEPPSGSGASSGDSGDAGATAACHDGAAALPTSAQAQHGLPHPAAAQLGSTSHGSAVTLPPGLQELATIGAQRHQELWTQRALMHQRQQQQRAADAAAAMAGAPPKSVLAPGGASQPVSAGSEAVATERVDQRGAGAAAPADAPVAQPPSREAKGRPSQVSSRGGENGSVSGGSCGENSTGAGSSWFAAGKASRPSQPPQPAGLSLLRHSDRSAFTAFTVFLPGRVAAAAAATAENAAGPRTVTAAGAAAPMGPSDTGRRQALPLFTNDAVASGNGGGGPHPYPAHLLPLPVTTAATSAPVHPHILPPVPPLQTGNTTSAYGGSRVSKPTDQHQPPSVNNATAAAAAAALNGSLGTAAAAAAAAAAVAAHMPYASLQSRAPPTMGLPYGVQAAPGQVPPPGASTGHAHMVRTAVPSTVLIPESVLQLIAHLSGRAAAEIPVPESVTAAPPVVVAAKPSSAARQAAVAKYLEKRKHRNFHKKVRYESRKRLAEARPRVRGQFVKATTAAAAAAAAAEAPHVTAPAATAGAHPGDGPGAPATIGAPSAALRLLLSRGTGPAALGGGGDGAAGPSQAVGGCASAMEVDGVACGHPDPDVDPEDEETDESTADV